MFIIALYLVLIAGISIFFVFCCWVLYLSMIGIGVLLLSGLSLMIDGPDYDDRVNARTV